MGAALLLDLRPGNVGYSGVAAGEAGMPALREIPDWNATAAAWRQQAAAVAAGPSLRRRATGQFRSHLPPLPPAGAVPPRRRWKTWRADDE